MKLDHREIEVVDDAVAILRVKTPAEKLQMVFQAFNFARTLMAAGIRYRNPHWSQEEIDREVARRIAHGSTNW